MYDSTEIWLSSIVTQHSLLILYLEAVRNEAVLSYNSDLGHSFGMEKRGKRF